MDCRICSKETDLVLDLGAQPIANSILDSPFQSEMIYPLHFYWCEECQYGQANSLPENEIFGGEYPYYSSINGSYVNQCKEWANQYIFDKNPQSVIEVGCNDGYMLKNFLHLTHEGYEPSSGPAHEARKKGVKVVEEYFKGTDHLYADLIIANNVLAHTPDIHGMAESMSNSLSKEGQVVIEFPDVNNLITNCYYDTIYHEHYSYFSLHSIERLFREYGLYLDKYEKIPSHGGSIRAYLSKKQSSSHFHEVNRQIDTFGERSLASKISNIQYLNGRKQFDSIALFGAAAKGNTFLNYLGIKSDLFDFCIDETPAKMGKFLPGSRIPIVGMEYLKQAKPKTLFILPWNFKNEIIQKTNFIKDWGGEHIWKL